MAATEFTRVTSTKTKMSFARLLRVGVVVVVEASHQVPGTLVYQMTSVEKSI